MNQPKKKPAPGQNGPDPAVQEAVQRLSRTELSPLEEVMFKSWSTANELDEVDESPGFDLRGIYKETGGKVMPPGQLRGEAEKTLSIKTIMDAQKLHDESSPIKLLMDAGGGSGGGDSLPSLSGDSGSEQPGQT